MYVIRILQCIALMAVAYGVGLIYLPAGVITAGILVLAVPELIARYSPSETTKTQEVD